MTVCLFLPRLTNADFRLSNNSLFQTTKPNIQTCCDLSAAITGDTSNSINSKHRQICQTSNIPPVAGPTQLRWNVIEDVILIEPKVWCAGVEDYDLDVAISFD